MSLLLDTSLVSELRKVRSGRANPGVAAWARAIDPSEAYISAITVHELEVGVLRMERRDLATGAVLRAWLREAVTAAFEGRMLPVDAAVATRAARLQVPDPCPKFDALIAATALVHGMTVVTRNVADFAPMGVRLLNPWESFPS